jgi:hypothetical protein
MGHPSLREGGIKDSWVKSVNLGTAPGQCWGWGAQEEPWMVKLAGEKGLGVGGACSRVKGN